ncbi:adenylosuccinate synthase [Desulfothermus naphthae]
MKKNRVIIGSQWGDEGKGKIVDLLSQEADVIVRFQGGANAGHTLVVGDKKIILHLVPSGILHESKLCLIGNGVVLDPEIFCEEIDELERSGIVVSPQRLKISYKTHLIMPYHKMLDNLRESKKSGSNKIGTTGRGIGPAYEDKVSRVGIRACDVLDEKRLREKIERALAEKNVLFKHYFDSKEISLDEILEKIGDNLKKLRPYLADISTEIYNAMNKGKAILFEGAQGTFLDIDHGTYPYVTSSNTVASNVCAGAGCGIKVIDEILGVVKSYTTRVGGGPFPTELNNETGEYLRSKGGEFGATTGRPRRCGWLDLVVLRESVRLNNITSIVLTKLDVLSGLDPLKICTKYQFNGKEILYPPQIENGLAKVTPIYETMKGWNEDISQIRNFDELPPAALDYIRFIEDSLEVKVKIISVGPERSQTIFR